MNRMSRRGSQKLQHILEGHRCEQYCVCVRERLETCIVSQFWMNLSFCVIRNEGYNSYNLPAGIVTVHPNTHRTLAKTKYRLNTFKKGKLCLFIDH